MLTGLVLFFYWLGSGAFGLYHTSPLTMFIMTICLGIEIIVYIGIGLSS